jgi:2-polyprenyl-6-methoxyphenol hydroxylase-like FAD-dependent oxidoreductase
MTTNSSNRQNLGAHAVVIGGSMAGLLAARVLSERFERVTIVEKDHFPATAENRKGVPQGRHVHGLLTGGFHAMQSLFPGLEAELLQAGAPAGDLTGSFRWHQFGRYKARFESGLGGITISRPLLEATLRARVLALPNVEVREGARVHGLLSTPDRRTVTGVRLQRQGEDGEALHADLTLDASGRGSRTPTWLEALGYERPAEDEIHIDVMYASRTYTRKPGDLGGDIGCLSALGKRTAAAVAVEGDRWHVMLGGFLGDHPPTDEAGYLAFAQSLPASDVYDLIRDAEPLSDVVTHRFPSSLRRRYERMDRFPEGLVVAGDAVCSFNPVYGQGMSVAALEALALRDCLNAQADSVLGLPARFFEQAAKVVDTPWRLAAGADLALPGVKTSDGAPKRSVAAALTERYLAGLHAAASHDEVVCRAFFEVVNLLAPPSALFHPRVALRVLRAGLAERRPLSAVSLVPDDLAFDDLTADAPVWQAQLVERNDS